MSVPVYGFFTVTPRAEYYQMGREGRGEAWWRRLGEVMKEKCPDVETIIMCDPIDRNGFLYVQKFPDMETYAKYGMIVRSQTHITKYFDITVQLGWKRDDVEKAFGKHPWVKESW